MYDVMGRVFKQKMENETQEQKLERMTTQPVEKLILKLAIPTILSMLITTFYNLVDTIFVGTLEDTHATAALSTVFSLMTIIQAIGFFCGHGSGNYISRALGQKKTDKAETMASTGFVMAILLGFVVLVAGQIFARPFATLLGARDEQTLKYTIDYMRIILLGAPLMTAQLVLNNQLRFQGNALFAMFGICIGGVANIGLDALFINVFHLEVLGVAIATLIGQFLSFVVLYIGAKKSDSVKISLKGSSFTKEYLLEIVRGGTPSLCRQTMGGVSTTIMNTIAFSLGQDPAQAAIGVVSRIMMFISSAMIGFGQGFQPVCGFNYGAAKYKRVYKAFVFCVRVSTVFLIVVSIAGYFFSPTLIAFMQRGDSESVETTVQLGITAIRHQLYFLPLMSLVVMSNMMLQTVGSVVRASLLAMSRQGIMLIPVVYLLSLLFGMEGFLWAQGIADLLSFILTLPLVIPVIASFAKDKNYTNKQPVKS